MEELTRVFGWGLVIGLFVGVLATWTLLVPLHRRWFGSKLERNREEELQRLRRQVAELRGALDEKDKHIRAAISAAMEELQPKTQREAK